MEEGNIDRERIVNGHQIPEEYLCPQGDFNPRRRCVSDELRRECHITPSVHGKAYINLDSRTKLVIMSHERESIDRNPPSRV